MRLVFIKTKHAYVPIIIIAKLNSAVDFGPQSLYTLSPSHIKLEFLMFFCKQTHVSVGLDGK